jgi:hypothetical protein
VGEVVKIGDAAVIARGARIAARRIEFDGTVRQSAAFAGRRVQVNGIIDGDAEITAKELVISSDARVTGTFTYRAPEEIEIPASFADEGRVTFVPLEEDERFYYERKPRFPWFVGTLWRLMLAILGGAILLAIFPRFSDRVAAAARARPWPAIGWGAVGIVIFFACIGLMVLSILGIPLAMVLAVATPFLLLVAYIYGAFALSMIGARQVRRSVPEGWLARLATLVAGLIALSLVARGRPDRAIARRARADTGRIRGLCYHAVGCWRGDHDMAGPGPHGGWLMPRPETGSKAPMARRGVGFWVLQAPGAGNRPLGSSAARLRLPPPRRVVGDGL